MLAALLTAARVDVAAGALAGTINAIGVQNEGRRDPTFGVRAPESHSAPAHLVPLAAMDQMGIWRELRRAFLPRVWNVSKAATSSMIFSKFSWSGSHRETTVTAKGAEQI